MLILSIAVLRELDLPEIIIPFLHNIDRKPYLKLGFVCVITLVR